MTPERYVPAEHRHPEGDESATPDHDEGSIGTSRSLERIEREEALRLAQFVVTVGANAPDEDVVKFARALLALAADLEAAERRAKDESDLEHQSGRRAYWRARAEAAERERDEELAAWRGRSLGEKA